MSKSLIQESSSSPQEIIQNIFDVFQIQECKLKSLHVEKEKLQATVKAKELFLAKVNTARLTLGSEFQGPLFESAVLSLDPTDFVKSDMDATSGTSPQTYGTFAPISDRLCSTDSNQFDSMPADFPENNLKDYKNLEIPTITHSNTCVTFDEDIQDILMSNRTKMIAAQLKKGLTAIVQLRQPSETPDILQMLETPENSAVSCIDLNGTDVFLFMGDNSIVVWDCIKKTTSNNNQLSEDLQNAIKQNSTGVKPVISDSFFRSPDKRKGNLLWINKKLYRVETEGLKLLTTSQGSQDLPQDVISITVYPSKKWGYVHTSSQNMCLIKLLPDDEMFIHVLVNNLSIKTGFVIAEVEADKLWALQLAIYKNGVLLRKDKSWVDCSHLLNDLQKFVIEDGTFMSDGKLFGLTIFGKRKDAENENYMLRTVEVQSRFVLRITDSIDIKIGKPTVVRIFYIAKVPMMVYAIENNMYFHPIMQI